MDGESTALAPRVATGASHPSVSQCVDHRPSARSHDQSSLPLDAQPVLAVAECDTHELASVVSRLEIWRMLAWSWCVMCTAMG